MCYSFILSRFDPFTDSLLHSFIHSLMHSMSASFQAFADLHPRPPAPISFRICFLFEAKRSLTDLCGVVALLYAVVAAALCAVRRPM